MKDVQKYGAYFTATTVAVLLYLALNCVGNSFRILLGYEELVGAMVFAAWIPFLRMTWQRLCVSLERTPSLLEVFGVAMAIAGISAAFGKSSMFGIASDDSFWNSLFIVLVTGLCEGYPKGSDVTKHRAS